jgi:hypothetical protein
LLLKQGWQAGQGLGKQLQAQKTSNPKRRQKPNKQVDSRCLVIKYNICVTQGSKSFNNLFL